MTVSETVTFGDLLRHYRQMAGLTQEALAERAAISVNAVAALERGRRGAPRPHTVSMLIAALGLTSTDRAQLLSAAIAARGPVPETEAPALSPPSARLPAPPTVLIGREREVAAVVQLLAGGARLVTVTGPGGVGKTRLAIQVAAGLQHSYADGAAFVDLSSVRDAALVPGTLTQSLGLRESGSRKGRQLLVEQLQEQDLLLVLDNLEQVVESAVLLAELIDTCPRLTILATSRSPLHLRAEQQFPLAPLGVPDGCSSTLGHALASDAVQLFAARAQAVQPGFELTEKNAGPIAEMCRLLDGVPLAIELAAARVRLMPPDALLARLDQRLTVLVGGPRDLPARQQTLRDTILWSFELLEEEEKQIFRRAAVFEGGFSLEALEAVWTAGGNPEGTAEGTTGGTTQGNTGETIDALQGVALLQEKSLLQTVNGQREEARFTMLQTIRDFALEQLEEYEEAGEVRRRHAEFFLGVAEEADPHLRSGDRTVWLERLSRDADNLRAALTWAETDTGDGHIGLRLAVSLTWFWRFREWLTEGRSWLERMLARPDSADGSVLRAKALYGIGMLAWYQGDLSGAATHTEEALVLLRAHDDKPWMATTSRLLGLVRMGQGDPAAARPLLEESRALFHEGGDTWGEAMTLYRLGLAAAEMGDATARTYYEQSLTLFERVQDSLGTSVVLNALAVAAAAEGDQAKALAAITQGLPLARASSERWDLARFLLNAGTLWLRQGDDEQARALFVESLLLWRDIGHMAGVGLSLAGLADVAAARHESREAGRLYKAASRSLQPEAAVITSTVETDLVRHIDAARKTLDPKTFEEGWTEGDTRALAEMIDELVEE